MTFHRAPPWPYADSAPYPCPMPSFLAPVEPEAIRGLGNICPACSFHK